MARSSVVSVGMVWFVAVAAAVAADEATASKELTGKVTAVTLYRGQASVTRTIALEAGQGHHRNDRRQLAGTGRAR